VCATPNLGGVPRATIVSASDHSVSRLKPIRGDRSGWDGRPSCGSGEPLRANADRRDGPSRYREQDALLYAHRGSTGSTGSTSASTHSIAGYDEQFVSSFVLDE
jgi:hypothetical protein